MEHLQSGFIHLSDCRNQITKVIPFIQKEIEANWDHVIDKKYELEKRKKEFEKLKKELVSVQIEENNFQKDKKKLSKQLKKEETDLQRSQKQLNKKGNQVDRLHARKEMIANLKKNPTDKFVGKLFKSQNKLATQRLARIIVDRRTEKDNLSEKIQNNQTQITSITDDIDYQQKRLNTLQRNNIRLQNQIDEILNEITENSTEIEQTEQEIDSAQGELKNLAVTLVEIATESQKQHSLYKKSRVASLDDLDYERLLRQSSSNFNIQKEVSDVLNSRYKLGEQFED